MPGWIDRDLRDRGICDERVLRAMAAVRREDFVPPELRAVAYEDGPLPIGASQTISQPFIVAYMTQLLDVQPNHRVLEIGTGSGYQTAVLMQLSDDVYSIESIPSLFAAAAERLAAMGLAQSRLRCGDGAEGWSAHAPFDRVLLTCAPRTVPPALTAQLRAGGRLVAPVGPAQGDQWLEIVEKDAAGHLHVTTDLPVRFVPLRAAADR